MGTQKNRDGSFEPQNVKTDGKENIHNVTLKSFLARPMT